MIDVNVVADNADMIIDGYAYTKCDKGYKVLNLDDVSKSAVITTSGEIFETTMEDRYNDKVLMYYNRNKDVLSDCGA